MRRAERPDGVKLAAYKLDPDGRDDDDSRELPEAKPSPKKVFQTFG